MELPLRRYMGLILALLTAQAGALAVSWQSIGYLFPWVILIVVNLSLPLHLPEMSAVILCVIQTVIYTLVFGLAFGGTRVCRWLLLLLLLLHAVGIVLCHPWTMSRTF